MSRRSILLATTCYVAIGWLAAVGPASAHGFGFGGFGGGQGGLSSASTSPAHGNLSRPPIQSMSNSMSNPGETRFGHTPSAGGPAAGSNIAGSRIEPARIPAASNAPLANTSTPALPQSVRPAQLSPTITSSSIGVRQPVDAAGIATAPLQSRVSAAGVVSAPVTARYPVNQPSGTEPNPSSRIISAEGDGKLPKPGNTEGVPNVTGAPRIIGRIIGQAPSADHMMTSQSAASANARATVDTLTPAYLMPTPADVARVADEVAQKRIAVLQQKKKDLIAQLTALEAQIAGIEFQIIQVDPTCQAEIKALEQAVQKSGGDAGEAAGAVIGGLVGGPLGALAGAAAGATIGEAASAGATYGLNACKQQADLEKQIPDLRMQVSVRQAALATVDTALAKAIKEQEAPRQPLDARIGNLAGPTQPQSARR